MELRAKSGILRGREFVMKDFYSFHRDEADLAEYYEKMKAAYVHVFERAGVGEKTYLTFASGGSFSKYSHEFQMLTDAGEDIISICDKCRVAINKEIREEQKTCPSCGGTDFHDEKAIEVGNIFELKTKFSGAFGLTYKDEEGKLQPIQMGCYGIGLGRLMGAVVEGLSDEKGIVWPEAIAPFRVHLLNLSVGDASVDKAGDELLTELEAKGIEVLYDDRTQATAGEKFADSDLLGIPHRIVVSKKTLGEGKYEYKARAGGEAQFLTKAELLVKLGA
jgi:prolyl-tRNA synthetase